MIKTLYPEINFHVLTDDTRKIVRSKKDGRQQITLLITH